MVCGTYASRRIDDRLGVLSAEFLSAWRSKCLNSSGSVNTHSCCLCALYDAIIANINVSIYFYKHHGSAARKSCRLPICLDANKGYSLRDPPFLSELP